MTYHRLSGSGTYLTDTPACVLRISGRALDTSPTLRGCSPPREGLTLDNVTVKRRLAVLVFTAHWPLMHVFLILVCALRLMHNGAKVLRVNTLSFDLRQFKRYTIWQVAAKLHHLMHFCKIFFKKVTQIQHWRSGDGSFCAKC